MCVVITSFVEALKSEFYNYLRPGIKTPPPLYPLNINSG